LEFRDPYTLKSLLTSLVRPKLEYASCVWNPFYDVRVDRVEPVQRRFFLYALCGLGWTDMHDLQPYVMFIFNVRSGIGKLTKLVVRSRFDKFVIGK
jgi:hypothetical protein